MRVLLDTHALLWWLDGDERLSQASRTVIGDERNEVVVSAVSAWEIAIKVRIGKLPGAVQVEARFLECLDAQGFETLDITPEHALRAGRLAGVHRDPFDRMLIAPALSEELVLVSNERLFDDYGVRRIW